MPFFDINRNEMKVLAGIVLYNPEPIRLKENIDAIHQQVDTVLLIENGSTNKDYKVHLTGYDNILYIDNHASMGIAYALNQICGYAYTHGYEWALTLDQDSVATPGMVDTYKGIAKDNIGIIGCYIEDRNYKEPNQERYEGTFGVPWVITSASFTNVKAWKKCGGFDNEMFIDFVDTDICYSMRNAGYKILITFHTKLIHELGINTTIKHIPLIKRIQVENHNSVRKYYRERNLIYLTRKYKDYSIISTLKTTLKDIAAVVLYEHNKLPKLWAMAKGLCNGIFMKPKFEHITQEFLSLEVEEL